MNIIVFANEMLRQFPRQVIGSFLLLVLVNLVSVASIFTIAPVVDFMIDPGLGKASALTHRVVEVMVYLNIPITLMSLLALMLGFQIVRSGLFIVAMYSILSIKYDVLRELLVGVLRDFLRARWLFFSSSSQGTLLNTFNREMAVVGDTFGHMGVFFANCLQVLFYLSVPFYISWQVTAISLTIALVFAFPLLSLGKVKYRLGQLNTSTANDMNNVLHETLGAAKVVLGFGNQKKSLTQYSAAYEAHRLATLKAQTLDIATPTVYEPLGLLVVVIALLASQSFGVALSETVVLLWALKSSLPLIGRVVAQRNSLFGFFPSYEQVRGLQNRARELEQESGSDVFGGFNREIRMKDIVFAYPDKEPVLKDVNISIPEGSMVAIVGPSGAGKSTLIDVLLGFNTPAIGSVTFDDCPLNRYDIVSYRRRIGYVPQDAILFNASITENLLWSKEDATEEAITRACEQANVVEFVKDLPEGYETVVGDRGVRLSGGQAQRLALARAILREPGLLILDEATSSLDTQSERLIQEAIEVIAKQTTVVVIAHRLSTIVNASYIYVLVGGEVVEEGTYTELIKKSGVFTQMNQLQMLETAG
jgi:ATP-binding cassette subfamily B protein